MGSAMLRDGRCLNLIFQTHQLDRPSYGELGAPQKSNTTASPAELLRSLNGDRVGNSRELPNVSNIRMDCGATSLIAEPSLLGTL